LGPKNQLRRKREAERTLSKLFEHPNNVLVVHYSCESFYDRPEGASPRTTSIAVRYLASGQTTSFSIHQVAEELGIAYNDIVAKYDDIEREMLRRFFDFVRRHSQFYWLHWNMRDINYGFAALEHRARVLGVEPEHIVDDYKVDLARILIDLYTPRYVGHPRLQKILQLNHIGMRDFLTGREEAEAFDAGNFAKLHLSTLRKVDALANLAERTEAGQLKTNASWWERNGSSIIGAVDALTDNWVVKIFGLLALVVGIVAGIITLFA